MRRRVYRNSQDGHSHVVEGSSSPAARCYCARQACMTKHVI
jgi:hypothetical protein